MIELLGKSHPCECGRTHLVSTQGVSIESDALRLVSPFLSGFSDILLVADSHTWKAAGEQTAEVLCGAGFAVKTCILPGDIVCATEEQIGRVLLAADPTPSFVLAVGSGTVNDIARYVARRIGVEYGVVATASSMDGYASNVSPLLREGVKVTYPGQAPRIVVGDVGVLCAAPPFMAAAGLGDVLGKITARLDWRLGHVLEGEYYCPWVDGLVLDAIQGVLELPENAQRSQTVVAVLDGLVATGLCIQMCNDSRPASGSEHHIAHFLEMRGGNPCALHGQHVGIAVFLMMRLYEKFFLLEELPALPTIDYAVWESGLQNAFDSMAGELLEQMNPWAYVQPQDWDAQRKQLGLVWEQYRQETANFPGIRAKGKCALKSLGGVTTPQELGYSRELMMDSLRYAWAIRPHKQTLLRLIMQLGLLETMAQEVLEEVYGA